ncbi:MAG: FmdB family transcriptional regulator [Candidatus Hydrogenedentes bacterium]|nr:FmdB family transcriptional regulator [Candidatus Hydrogenedentota bacterium]
MPVYTYQIINEDGSDGECFEVIHGMNDPPLTVHPETGRPVKRVFTAPHIAGWGNSRQAKEMLSDANVEKHGFTKYVRSGKGQYEKRAGKGPGTIDVSD